MLSLLRVTGYSGCMWKIFIFTWMLLLVHGVGQVEVKNEFNQAYVRLIDIYCRLNPISIDFHLAHKITVAGSHFSMPLSFGLV